MCDKNTEFLLSIMITLGIKCCRLNLSSTVHVFIYLSVPAPVSDLHIRHADETSLSALWSHAPGSASRSGHRVELLQGNTTRGERKLDADMRECTFNVLTPGRAYQINVITLNGAFCSSASVSGRTGKATLPSTFSKFTHFDLMFINVSA